MRFGCDLGVFEIDSLPGCSQVAVSHGSFVPHGKRGCGAGKAKHLLHLEKMKELGYNAAICTVDTNNVPQERILTEAGWSKIMVFTSSKTGHMVGIWMKTLG